MLRIYYHDKYIAKYNIPIIIIKEIGIKYSFLNFFYIVVWDTIYILELKVVFIVDQLYQLIKFFIV